MSNTTPDAPRLVKILKQLALHRRALYESGYDSTAFLDRHSGLHRRFCDALKSDDQETATQLLDSLLEEAGIPCAEQARKEMHNRLALVMDTWSFTMAYGAPEFDAGYADFGPEAAAMCDTWGSKADRDAYWHHPLLWLCRQLEETIGIDRDILKAAAFRLTTAQGLREMEPCPNPDGSKGDPGWPDRLELAPKFNALDESDTTKRLWRELVNDHQDVLIDAELLDVPRDGKSTKSANGKQKKQKRQRGPEHTELAVREAIEKALADQNDGVAVKTVNGRVIKKEVTKRCKVKISPDHLKNIEEWRFYYEHNCLRPLDEPTETERERAVDLLNELLPEHPDIKRQMASMDHNEKLDYIGKLTRCLIPLTKMAEDRRTEVGHQAIRQFKDDRSRRILPKETPPGENTPAVSRFEATPPDEN